MTYGVCCVLEDQLSRGSFPTVRATAVGPDAVLAGDPKDLVYYVISKLNKDTPSRRSEEERIRIHLRVWANIQNHGYRG